ncbi:MAG: hypothetical protein A2901_00130 [Elusimicrobia bacterium RIFCSPLOWO2_01_FULL_54_10]|nr:MAG: hypothetical protein A2901_00130 [Elusimicrobia bacterium RIFCSPLOWO2_01_FULL_54_10]
MVSGLLYSIFDRIRSKNPNITPEHILPGILIIFMHLPIMLIIASAISLIVSAILGVILDITFNGISEKTIMYIFVIVFLPIFPQVYKGRFGTYSMFIISF